MPAFPFEYTLQFFLDSQMALQLARVTLMHAKGIDLMRFKHLWIGKRMVSYGDHNHLFTGHAIGLIIPIKLILSTD